VARSLQRLGQNPIDRYADINANSSQSVYKIDA